jgi:hypothetical protein
MTPPRDSILSRWEAEGNRHAATLDPYAGAVVIGEQPSTAAEVALGIARAQARRRRVAVIDAVGELAPIEDLVPMDAPYGIVDNFFYGVSLNRVGHPVDPARNLILVPSGALPIDHEALLGSDRWAKLLDEFRAAGGLLLIVAPAEVSALSSLLQVMDGVVLVGNVVAAPGTHVLVHASLPVVAARPTPAASQPAPIARPPASTALPFPPPPPPDAPWPTPAEGAPALVPPWARGEEFAAPDTQPEDSARSISSWLAIVGGAIVVAVLLTWATTSLLTRHNGADSFLARSVDSARTAARSGAAAPASATAAALVESAPFAVEVADATSETGANTEIEQQTRRELPAVTYSPHATADGGKAFLVLVGAYRDSMTADSLLRAMRSRRFVRSPHGRVVRLPFAVAVQRGVPREQASMFVHAYQSKGLPVYALLQSDGTATLFAGAFSDIEQAQPLVTSFQANGEQPIVLFRTGRAF